MILFTFSRQGWESWDMTGRPVIREGMPVLVDEDLLFDDGGTPRATVAVNRWLRELPINGGPAASTWWNYARVLRAWMEFLATCAVGVFGSRERLRQALGAYAEHRCAGPLPARFAVSTWNQHMSVLSVFYRWARAEGHATAEPFSYRNAVAVFDGVMVRRQVNTAARRRAKPHTTIKYLESDFADMFVRALRGLAPDGTADTGFRGRNLARNAVIAELALATGLRLAEFTHLLVYELPVLPAAPTELPIPFPVPVSITKGGIARTTWISYSALASAHRYVGLERAADVEGSSWRPAARAGGPLRVSRPDARGGWINGVRTGWDALSAAERRRLVAPDGGSCLLGVRADGGPFTDWNTVFTRTSNRVRARWEPRFPAVTPHRLRHTFSMATMERLVGGYYQQAAQLVADTGGDAALTLYLSKADPLAVLRDLLGHSSVRTTEHYLSRLDMTRVYRDAYERAGMAAGLVDADTRAEADDEFADEDGDEF
ncbi:site-specific integrase [Solihabitans fulvus]|uniref:Site-specific integrase n=2 Tax=Solihabitans fulvus TaxID=1892852 RepID=A0A5B2XJ77_9PSEU|nr:site-specific integrase [Solihabitans fulvus]